MKSCLYSIKITLFHGTEDFIIVFKLPALLLYHWYCLCPSLFLSSFSLSPRHVVLSIMFYHFGRE